MKTIMISILLILVSVSCTTNSETKRIVLPPFHEEIEKDTQIKEFQNTDLVDEKESKSFSSTSLYEDKNYILTNFDSNNISIKMKNENANLDDLVYFIICTYRKNTASKLAAGKVIDSNDALLVKLVLEINLYTLTFFDNAIASALDLKYHLPIPEVDNTIKDIIEKSLKNSYKDSNFNNLLSSWHDCFSWLDPKIKEKDIEKVFYDKIEHIKRIPVAPYVVITLIPGCPVPKGYFESKQLRPYKQKWKMSATTVSQIWLSLNKKLTDYLQNLKYINREIQLYYDKSSDSQSITYLKGIQNYINNELEQVISKTYRINYDFPFAVFCKNCYISIQGCMSSYNDNEEKMEELVYEFNNRVSGIKMLEHIVSPYTAKIYTQLLEILKAELGDKWINIKTTCKLYDINISIDPLNTKNDLRVNDNK